MGLNSGTKVSKKSWAGLCLKSKWKMLLSRWIFFWKSHKSIEPKLLCQMMKIGADLTFKKLRGFMSLSINLIPIDLVKFNIKVREYSCLTILGLWNFIRFSIEEFTKFGKSNQDPSRSLEWLWKQRLVYSLRHVGLFYELGKNDFCLLGSFS